MQKVRLFDANASILKGQFGQSQLALDCCFHDGNSRFSVRADSSVRREVPEIKELFCEVLKTSSHAWNAAISAHAKLGDSERAFKLYEKMQEEGIRPSKFTFLATLKACSCIGTVRQGRLIHEQIMRSEIGTDVVLGTTLVDVYAKCGCLEDACKVFDGLPNRNVVSWNAIISGYAQHGNGHHALKLFEKMHNWGEKPDNVTFSCILKACGSIRAMGHGRLIHDKVIEMGLESDVVVGSALVDMYAKCGSLENAHRLFDKLMNRNVVSWNIILAGYALNENGHSTLSLFEKMQQQGVKPDKVTYLCALKACGILGAIHEGKLIHDHIIRSEVESDTIIGNTLIDMYVKCGSIEEGSKVFKKLQSRDVISWNALIAGCVKNENALSSLELFEQMQQEGIKPSKFTLSCVVNACGSTGSIEQGKHVHDWIIEFGMEIDVVLGNTLVDMYVKCGSLEAAHKMLHVLPVRDVLSWNALIAGYAQRGNYRLVEECLEDMQRQGLKPSGGTLTSILVACSHAGNMEKGCMYFNSIQVDLGIIPNIEHFNCMIDLIGRAGCLKEAEDLLQTMPMLPDITGWRSLLAACSTFGNVKLGRQCFDEAVCLEPYSSGIYVLMSKIYTDARMWEDVGKIQELKIWAESWRKPGKAWIAAIDKLHEFIVGDETHPFSDNIYVKLRRITKLAEQEGFLPYGANARNFFCGSL